MLRKAAALLFVSVSIAWVNCGTTQSHFVYAAIPAANQIVAYREDPNSGVLTAVSGSPFPTGTSPQAVVIHSSKNLLYVANAGDNDLSLFKIASGGLTEVTPRTPVGTTPSLLALDMTGNFLYVGNVGSHDISAFSVGSDGKLAAVSGSPFPIGMSPLNMQLSPSGSFLYVTGSQPGLVLVFSLNAGVPTPIAVVPTGASLLASPFGLAIDSKGSFLYVGNGPPDNTLSEFTLGSNGVPTAINGSPIGGTLSNPFSLFVDTSGKYLYVANEGSSNITAYTIGSDGALTLLTNSPFSTGTQPNIITGDPNGKYLLVGMQSGSIQVFGLDTSTGTLTSFATYSVGNGPSSIVVLQ